MGRQVLIPYLAFCSILLGQVVWPFEPQNVALPISYTMGDYVGWAGFHNAVDIPAAVGDTVMAVIIGVVRDYTSNADSLNLNAGRIDISTSVSDTIITGVTPTFMPLILLIGQH
ncbi:MAG: hypothetical protein ABIL70_07755 [candidate division WOR-3 bacterium]